MKSGINNAATRSLKGSLPRGEAVRENCAQFPNQAKLRRGDVQNAAKSSSRGHIADTLAADIANNMIR
jgi:hypothetical protein